MIKKIIYPVILLSAACNVPDKQPESKPHADATVMLNYAVKNILPHDTNAFTEGLLVHDGIIYEATGSPKELPSTESVVGPVEIATGTIDAKIRLNKDQYFGEGITLLNNKLYQLTYKNQLGFVYNFSNFKKLQDFKFASAEGWGLTTDGKQLIMSDGTHTLTYLDTVSFQSTKALRVYDENGAVDKLNELEFINGYIYANIYGTPFIVKVDTATGKVAGKLDMISLVNEARGKNPNALELNGIAYDAVNKKVYVTGKMWPNIYEISFGL